MTKAEADEGGGVGLFPGPKQDEVGLSPGRKEETREDRQDKVREKIAMRLLWLLICEIGGIALLFLFVEFFVPAFQWANLKDLIGLVLTPTITLVGTALGFYFGAKAEAAKQQG